MSKPKILIQLDTDPHTSVFDGVVAIDAGVDQLLRHDSVKPTQVRELVHGAMFTRGPDDLNHTAIFISGSDVVLGESLLQQITECFFGPMRVSVMLDANGANTTAAAAVLAAAKHTSLGEATVFVPAATGPVGQRVVRLLARQGASVRVGSRSSDRAEAVCQAVAAQVAQARLSPCSTSDADAMSEAQDGVQVVISAGALGVSLMSLPRGQTRCDLQVAIDLNAVPPAGIEGIEVTDKAVDRKGIICYGAIGVGGTKMKIHKAAVRRLFDSNDQILDAEEIFAIGQQLSNA